MKTLIGILELIGRILLFMGIASFILNFFDYELEILLETGLTGLPVQITLIVVGGILSLIGYLYGRKQE